jgi:hypothetical protein
MTLMLMTAVNFVDVHTYGFEGRVWPFAHRKGVGLVAMKVYGGIRAVVVNSALLMQSSMSCRRYAPPQAAPSP